MTDTPDWQSGVYSPQQSLGTFLGSMTVAVVTIPPNTESLIIVGTPTSATTSPTVVGVTSGLTYLVSEIPTPHGTGISPVFLASALVPIDSQVTINWPGGVTGDWYVVADADIRQIMDLTLANILATPGDAATQLGLIVMGTDGTLARRLLTDTAGRLISVPVGANAKQHATVANGTTILAAPTAGTVNRIYQFIASVATVPELVSLVGVASGVGYAVTNNVVAGYQVAAYLGGPIDVTEALEVADTTNNQNITYSLHYRNLPAD